MLRLLLEAQTVLRCYQQADAVQLGKPPLEQRFLDGCDVVREKSAYSPEWGFRVGFTLLCLFSVVSVGAKAAMLPPVLGFSRSATPDPSES